VKHPRILTTLCFIGLSSVQAGEAIEGRWATDPQNCGSGESLLVVDALSLRWRDAACAVKTSYRVKDSWHIGASCSADGATSNVPVKLELRGGRLLLDWAGAPPQEMHRCP
jgi:hypothetical protein